MKNLPSVLIDSDVWIGIYSKSDSLHSKSIALFKDLAKQNAQLQVTSLIVGEVATVLSYKFNQPLALKFVSEIEALPFMQLHISPRLHTSALQLFKSQTSRGTSYVDCTNVAVINEYNLSAICSFDKVYHTRFTIPNIAYSSLI